MWKRERRRRRRGRSVSRHQRMIGRETIGNRIRLWLELVAGLNAYCLRHLHVALRHAHLIECLLLLEMEEVLRIVEGLLGLLGLLWGEIGAEEKLFLLNFEKERVGVLIGNESQLIIERLYERR